MQKMNILVACNSAYVMPLTVMLASLFYNNKDVEFDVYLLQSSLTEKEKNALREFVISYEYNIYFIDVSYIFEKENIPLASLSIEAYYRLSAGEVLPPHLDRALWLDCDIIVNQSINELYNIDMGENCIAAVSEDHVPAVALRKKRIGMPNEYSYFNTGVILYDLKLYRENCSVFDIFDIIENKRESLEIPDQDILNLLFMGKIKALEDKYNNMSICLHKKFEKRVFNRADLADTVVIHYAGPKPWNRIYARTLEHLWYKYLLMTPYKNLYYSRYTTLKYKILRSSFMKLLFSYLPKLLVTTNNLLYKHMPSVHATVRDFYRKYVK